MVRAGLVACAMLLGSAPGAGAQVQPYQANDAAGFRNILPSGQNGRLNAVELAAYAANGARPAHSDDQLKMYGDLVYNAPGLTAQRLPDFFKDASFGVRPGEVERSYSPRADVTIQRDRAIRRSPRLRQHPRRDHVRGRLRGRRGPPVLHGRAAQHRQGKAVVVRRRRHRQSRAGSRHLDQRRRTRSPTSRPSSTTSTSSTGREGQRIQQDVREYVAGVQAYISDARLNPLLMPGEYAAIGRPTGPEDWTCARRGGHRQRDRRDLRQGRRLGAGVGAGAAVRTAPVRRQAGQGRVDRLPVGRRPRGAGDGAEEVLPVSAAARRRSRRAAWRCPTRGR